MFETISFSDIIYGIIVRTSFAAEGVNFFMPPDFSQQLAYMRHPTGRLIEPHVLRDTHFKEYCRYCLGTNGEKVPIGVQL